MTTHEVRIRFPAEAFETAAEAVGYAAGRGPGEYARLRGDLAAIRLEGRFLVVRRAAAERLAAAGVVFAYLHDNHGEVLAFPVND
jgi:hypothetical protein